MNQIETLKLPDIILIFLSYTSIHTIDTNKIETSFCNIEIA